MIDSIGKIFKDARRQKGLSIGQVCKGTKINQRVISAIEEDNFEVLTPVYMKSFLKMYAKFLGLDTEQILRQYYEYTGQMPQESVKPKILETEKNKTTFEDLLKDAFEFLREKRKLILIFLLIVFALFLFNRLILGRVRRSSKAARLKQEAVQEQARSKVEIISAVKLSDTLRLSVRAKADCWMRVKVDGKLIFQTTLNKGEFESWEAGEKIELKLGYPAGVDIELNGQLLEQFGKRGSKARYATITKEGIKIGR